MLGGEDKNLRVGTSDFNFADTCFSPLHLLLPKTDFFDGFPFRKPARNGAKFCNIRQPFGICGKRSRIYAISGQFGYQTEEMVYKEKFWKFYRDLWTDKNQG